ncbi:Cationic amino acid transporter (fragment) [Cupriavidus taiwanensis]
MAEVQGGFACPCCQNVRDRAACLPGRLSSVHPVHATPYFATWTVGLMFAAIAALVPLSVLAEQINIGTLAAFTLISVAVLVLRKTRPELPRAFRCPGVPVVPLLSISFCLFLMAHLQALTWAAFLI